MSSANNSRLQTLFSALLAFIIATGLWYLVVGRDHVETQVEVRVEYRGLPEGMIMRENIVDHLSVRLRGSAELLRNLHTRDLVYTVDLSNVKRGANAVHLDLSEIPNFKAFDILEVLPSRLVIEVDTLTERVVSLKPQLSSLPGNSPYLISNVVLEPSVVTIRGPEAQINSLNSLPVAYDPAANSSEGMHEVSVAITAAPHVEITPPVTTLHYTMELKTTDVQIQCEIEFDSGLGVIEASSTTAAVSLSIPENLADDKDYLDAIHIVASPNAPLAVDVPTDVPLMVMLPSGAHLNALDPASVSIVLKGSEDAWQPADSSFTMPMPSFGMHFMPPRVPDYFSIGGHRMPPPMPPLPDELTIQPANPAQEEGIYQGYDTPVQEPSLHPAAPSVP